MKLAPLVEHWCPPLHRVLRRLNKTQRYFKISSGLAEDMHRGHYYSPLPAVRDALEATETAQLKPTTEDLPAIDLCRESQLALLKDLLPYARDFAWSANPQPGLRFFLDQPNFPWGDAIMLQAMIRHFKPKRIIEIGSGHSSALMLDTDQLHLGKTTTFTFIEPYPELLNEKLTSDDRQRVTVHPDPVQSVPLSVYEQLEAGDFLFVDSSHILKAGSDLNHILFEVVPRLKTGVIIHFHDIFWPFDYPPAWMALGRAFNEGYALRAFLQFNDSFKIRLWVPFLAKHAEPQLRSEVPDLYQNIGASIWLERVK
jgi:predicted O-methyltransferase YrrM